MNHTEVLGVSPSASRGEIQAAFRRSALEVHPDHSNSPEAAEAFARIKEARDELMKRAIATETVRDAATIQQATAVAVQATTTTAFTQVDDPYAGLSAQEIQHIQQLDELVRQYAQKSFLRRIKQDPELHKHHHKIKTNFKRLDGRY